jgi:hypothetical protein
VEYLERDDSIPYSSFMLDFMMDFKEKETNCLGRRGEILPAG